MGNEAERIRQRGPITLPRAIAWMFFGIVALIAIALAFFIYLLF